MPPLQHSQSLVFGGNFLHSFGILKQLKIAQVEDTTKVPQKFRYPFFTEMLWYVLAKYVFTLLGRSHLDGEAGREDELVNQPHVHLTHYELFGLKEIVMFLYDLPPHRKNVPELIKDPVQLIKDVRSLVERHCKDSAEAAVTGIPVLRPDLNRSANATPVIAALQSHDDSGAQHTEQSSQMHVNDSGNVSDDGETTANNFVSPKAVAVKNSTRGPYKKQSGEAAAANGSASNGRLTEKTHHNNSANVPRRRRRRCKTCVPCNSTECGHCAFCLDMVSDLIAGLCRTGYSFL